jgi:predicted O-methyltransferase YrrM
MTPRKQAAAADARREAAPEAARIRATIERIQETGIVAGGDGRRHEIGRWSLTPRRGRMLGDLCRAQGVKATLEIGMAWGLSTLYILEALADAHPDASCHVVMDPYERERFHDGGLSAVRAAGAEQMLEFYPEPSEIVLPRMLERGRQFDLVFIDGDHRFDGVFVDAVLANKLLKPGAVMVLDDAWFDPVYLTCKFLESNYGYELIGEVKGSGDTAQAYREAPRISDSEGALNPAFWRAQMRAYRKPLIERERGFFDFVRFELTELDLPREAYKPHVNLLSHDALDALARGEVRLARRLLMRALRLDPLRAKTYFRFVRTYLPGWMARATSGERRRAKQEAR